MPSTNIPCSLIIVTYNAGRVIDECFQSLQKQTCPPTELVIIDNASNDQTVTKIQSWTNRLPCPMKFHQEKINTGFSAGYNKGINQATNNHVIIANQDMIFASDCFEQLLNGASRHHRAYMLGPRINRYPDKNILDTTGIEWLPDGRMLNRDEGEKDVGQHKKEEKIFGVPGTMALINKNFISEITHDGREIFDEDFFAYKEDTDLAWRAHKLGYEAWYIPQAQCYHVRSAKKSAGHSLSTTIASRKTKTPWQRFLATRNTWAMYYKNTELSYWLRNRQYLIMEIKKTVYVATFEPIIFWKAVFSFWKIIPKIRTKKLWLKRKRVSLSL